MQIRTKYANYMMIRDVNRRKVVKEYARERLLINAMRKNNILPVEIREIADEMIQAQPRNAAIKRITFRCVVSSKPRGNVHAYRISRHVFRHLADYNKLAGVQRALWG